MPVEYNPNAPLPDVPTEEPHDDLLRGIQEAITSPSPLLRIIEDPTLLGAHSKSKSKHHRRPSKSPHREHRSPYVVALALAEEERQANTLKSLLRTTGDHLEYERKRADEATSRAYDAELRLQRESFRVSAAESACKQLEEQYNSTRDELRRVQLRNDALEREVRRAREEVRRVEEENEELESSVERVRESTRHLEATLQEFELREESQKEQRRHALEKSFVEGEEEGWNAGYLKGIKEGKRLGYVNGVISGRKEGVSEGRTLGRMEERRNALDAFEHYMASEDDNTARDLRDYYPADTDTESVSSLGDSASRRGRY